MNATTTEIPELEAPGAGLPAPVLFVARRLFSLKCRLGNAAAFVEEFRDERRKISALIESCPPEQRNERILVPRLRGLEDSSRYYSVWMTLDHLRITNHGFEAIIRELSSGKKPGGTVSTADVKPDPAVTAAVEDEYEESCDLYLALMNEDPDLKTGTTHDHPWFGPLDAYRWSALAAMHMGIHRKQIEAIIARLKK